MPFDSQFKTTAYQAINAIEARSSVAMSKVDLSSVVTVDFESYWDTNYTLRKMSTSEYVRDKRFHAQMMGIKVGSGRVRVAKPTEIQAALDEIDWSCTSLLCHNTAFDGLILSHHYGVVPAFYLDTLSMARGLHSNDIGAGLDEVAQFYGVGNKLEGALDEAKGLIKLPPKVFARMAAYCKVDVQLTIDIFKLMAKQFPVSELRLVNQIIRMFCDPVLTIDRPRVATEHAREVAHKKALILSVVTNNDKRTGTEEDQIEKGRKLINSRDGYVALLRAEGVEPPTKLNPKGDITWAFAKTDIEFTALLEHPKQRVRELVEARLGIRSSINETRAVRFLEATRDGHRLPVGYGYYRAHTGRLGGANKMNMQNLRRGGELRKSIRAPRGYVLPVADSGQIEARINGWLWGQDDLLAEFKAKDQGLGVDPYCTFATLVYGRTIGKTDEIERFVGKTCFAADTPVITNNGIKFIVDVTTDDQLWDGIEWVQHQGLLDQGSQPVETAYGLTATPDHEVLTAGGWQAWHAVHIAPSLFQSALDSATSPSCGGSTTSHRKGSRGAIGLYAAARVALSRWSTPLRFGLVEARAATSAPGSRQAANATGSTSMQWPTTNIAPVCSIGLLRQSLDVLCQAAKHTFTTARATSLSMLSGVPIVHRFFGTSRLCPAGTSPSSRWIAKTPTAITSPATFASSHALQTQRTSGALPTSNNVSANSKQKSHVFDLANAGPRHRFTVLTERGPLIVHNCVLGLGFQMGAVKLQATLAVGGSGGAGPKVHMDLDQVQKIVNAYRQRNNRIKWGWDFCLNTIIPAMHAGVVGQWKCLHWEKGRIWLPNGMCLKYPGLRPHMQEGDTRVTWSYLRQGSPIKIYGGLLCENIVQALARIAVTGQLLEIAEQDRIVMMTHDENVAMVKTRRGPAALKRMLKIMSTSPTWAPDLPLTAEGSCEAFYSK